MGCHGHRYDLESHAVAFGYYGVETALNVGPELCLRTARPDRFGGEEEFNTGGWRLMGGPRVIATRRPARLALEGAWLWPLHQNLKGIQLGVERELILSVHWPSM